MNLKDKLKNRLIELPYNYKSSRELHSLAKYLNINTQNIEPLLKQLVNKDILTEKIQYQCPYCKEVTSLDKNLLNELLEENEGETFRCDSCTGYINPETNKTGFVYYDIKDMKGLKEW